MPAGCRVEPEGWRPVKAARAVAVLSFLVIVLWMMLLLATSCREMAPARPVTLFATILLKILSVYQLFGVFGAAATSRPLTWAAAIPAPSPAPGPLPRIRFPLIVTAPVPPVRTAGGAAR